MTPTVLVCLSPLRACKVLILPYLFTWLPMQNFYLHIFLSTYLSVKRLWPSQWSFCDVFDYFKTLIAVCSCHTNRIIILYPVLCKTLISFAADVAQYFARFCVSCLFMIHVSPMPPASSWLIHLYVSCFFMIGASSRLLLVHDWCIIPCLLLIIHDWCIFLWPPVFWFTSASFFNHAFLFKPL